jgi:hypothetical protein
MPVSDMVQGAGLTPQQVADLALEEDRAARRALARGDAPAAWDHTVERDALCRAMPKP